MKINFKYNKMFNMARVKKTRPVKDSAVAEKRTRLVGFRVRESDAKELERLAKAQGVGISTFGRLIVENYIAQHGRKRGRR